MTIFAAFAPSAASANAPAIETTAKQAFMIDYDTGSVLLNKEGDVQMHPSSMSKLMTAYVLESRMKDGRVKLDDKFKVSEKAWRMQGSKMFVELNAEIPVEDLLRGIVIQSGNDACIVVAEGISGTEEAFAEEMNRMAKEIGLQNSHFVNATGWPDEGHLMTARDLATLAYHVITDFPDRYHYYAEREFTHHGITQQNRNRLLGSTIGVDGLKTGHTEAGGYGITLSAKDPASNRRLILVINGMSSDNERAEEGEKLLRWGFREFQNLKLISAGQPVDNVDVWFGQKQSVAVAATRDVQLTVSANAKKEVKYTLAYDAPVPAPIKAGEEVAKLYIDVPGQERITVPLAAVEDVNKLGGLDKVLASLEYYLLGRK